jgi:hypothetical protein
VSVLEQALLKYIPISLSFSLTQEGSFRHRTRAIFNVYFPLSNIFPSLWDESEYVFHLFLVFYWLDVLPFLVIMEEGESLGHREMTSVALSTFQLQQAKKSASIGMMK